MATPTRVTHAEALARLSQADDHVNHGRQLVQQMQDNTTQMLGSSWHGTWASYFGQKMQGHTDDCTAILNKMANHVETCRAAINTQTNADAH